MIKIAFSQVWSFKQRVAAGCRRLSEATQPIQAYHHVNTQHISGGAFQAFPPKTVPETLQKNKK